MSDPRERRMQMARDFLDRAIDHTDDDAMAADLGEARALLRFLLDELEAET
jgi:hypothetical protein